MSENVNGTSDLQIRKALGTNPVGFDFVNDYHPTARDSVSTGGRLAVI
jgi:hypothetical protein